jgi:hypothetical protein
MKIKGYLYALGVSLLLTMFISNFYKVKKPLWQGITLTLIYIFIVHFGQGDDCLVYGLMDSSSTLYKTLTFQPTCSGGSCDINDKTNESDNITNKFTPEIGSVLSTESLDSKVHANSLYEENPLNENRLQPHPGNNIYYAHSNASYPQINRNQINQQDCTNDGSCLILEDENNLHPIRQSLKEVLPVPNIGPQELTIMNRLNPNLNANWNYPVAVEAHHSCATTDIRDFYNVNKPKSNNECQKCSSPNNNNNNNNNNDDNESGNNKVVKETFGLFETYHMEDLKDPIYFNAPPKGETCVHCVTGGCYGDLCSVNPHKRFERNDPLGI